MSGKIITKLRQRARIAEQNRSDRLQKEERARRWAERSPEMQKRIRAMSQSLREDTIRCLTMGLENFGKIPAAQRHESDE